MYKKLGECIILFHLIGLMLSNILPFIKEIIWVVVLYRFPIKILNFSKWTLTFIFLSLYTKNSMILIWVEGLSISSHRVNGLLFHNGETTLNIKYCLKTLDTFCNCQRPIFSLGVSQHMHKITNLWKFELSLSSKLMRDNNGRKTHHCHTKLCAFRCLIYWPQNLILRSRNQIRGK